MSYEENDDNYTTLEEHLKAQRSPYLQPSKLNFDSCDTPPPLVDVPETPDPSEPEADREGKLVVRSQASQSWPSSLSCEALLIRQSGPDCSSQIAFSPDIGILVHRTGSSCDNWKSTLPDEPVQMIAVETSNDVSSTPSQSSVEQVLHASKQASQKLNAAIGNRNPPTLQIHIDGMKSYFRQEVKEIHADEDGPEDDDHQERAIVINGRQSTSSTVSSPSSASEKPFDVKPPPKPTLPSLCTKPSDAKSSSSKYEEDDSITTSPTLSKFAILPIDGHPLPKLARIQSQSPPESSSTTSPEPRQTLPSLKTALNSVADSNGMPYLDPSPALSALTRPSPSTYSQFGPPSATYSQPSPMSTMSPPRLTPHPSYWRTTSHNSSVSTLSEYVSTPTSSITGLSPSHSSLTPAAQGPDKEHSNDIDSSSLTSSSGQLHDTGNTTFSEHGYRCTWPGCHAPPFQTQYLLNSHTNVHSNNRSHFCPVKGCARGPGGQGFKRKNEMIRHGLVHQSPGYVCPFCLDQQHKYPRPDNLQRHVRVHHPDKDRDDPLLRDVLAQRPEGGNRGRRRRLGS